MSRRKFWSATGNEGKEVKEVKEGRDGERAACCDGELRGSSRHISA